jgi:hypothetical protein
MGPLKILLLILSFFGVAALVFLAGAFLVDYIFDYSFRHSGDPASAAGAIVPLYFFVRFIICPVTSIAAGAISAWKIAKSDLSL